MDSGCFLWLVSSMVGYSGIDTSFFGILPRTHNLWKPFRYIEVLPVKEEEIADARGWGMGGPAGPLGVGGPMGGAPVPLMARPIAAPPR